MDSERSGEVEKHGDAGARLDVQNLLIRYGIFTAVNDVSFRVPAGEVFGLLGPNGAGKTSILSAIEGLLQPQSGSVSVAGFDLAKEPRKARAKLVVAVFKGSETVNAATRLIYVLVIVAGVVGQSPSSPWHSFVVWSLLGVSKTIIALSLAPGSVGGHGTGAILASLAYTLVFAGIGVRWFRWTVQ